MKVTSKEKESLDQLLDKYSSLQKELADAKESIDIWFNLAYKYQIQLDAVHNALELNIPIQK